MTCITSLRPLQKGPVVLQMIHDHISDIHMGLMCPHGHIEEINILIFLCKVGCYHLGCYKIIKFGFLTPIVDYESLQRPTDHSQTGLIWCSLILA